MSRRRAVRAQVVMDVAGAHEARRFEAQGLDTIVCNGVSMYFPSADYLLQARPLSLSSGIPAQPPPFPSPLAPPLLSACSVCSQCEKVSSILVPAPPASKLKMHFCSWLLACSSWMLP